MKSNRHFLPVFVMVMLACIMCLASCSSAGTAYISNGAGQNNGSGTVDGSGTRERDFEIDALLQPSGGKTYNVLVTVENSGADWEGTALLTIANVYGSIDPCGYETALSLPQGSKKEFAVRIPKNYEIQTDGFVRITLSDKKSKVAAVREFDCLLRGGADFMNLGILSDKYVSLTYLDMGGLELERNGRRYAAKLSKMEPGTLEEALGYLDILVIDSYDTSVITDEQLKAVEIWVDGGGALVIGTGGHAAKTMGKFGYLHMYDPAGHMSGIEANNSYVDLSQLQIAKIDDSGDVYTTYGTYMSIMTQGNGAIGVLPYSLEELGSLDASAFSVAREDFVRELLDEIIANTSNVNTGSQGGNSYYLLMDILNILGNGRNSLHFGGLKLIVAAYVIFVGPVLYLILRVVKKRDYYWWAVPASSLMGILIVYLAGRGFEVVNTKVYSVSAECLSCSADSVTYMRCYDAGHKAWTLKIADRYKYAGMSQDYYYGGEELHCYIRQEGGRLSVGANPEVGFEDCYFQAGGTERMGGGNIDGVGSIRYNGGLVTGTIVNNTSHDFEYFAVLNGADLFVYKNLAKGKTCDLSAAEEVYYASTFLSEYKYDFLGRVIDSRDKADIDILSALGVGIFEASSHADMGAAVVVGVTDKWDKAVDDDCSEMAYGCLYAIEW